MQHRYELAFFLEKYLQQMVNTAFAAITNPKDALDFFYERLYFAYSSDKNLLTNNIKKLESLYSNENEFKIKMILKITRPMVKLNYLLNGDRKVLELIETLKELDLNNQALIRPIVVFADEVLSKFIKDLFYFKKNITSNDLDEITIFIHDKIIEIKNFAQRSA
ncbi:hypothetical protein [Rickettsiales endosymbiont of Stachyamoeba lipophora]|uniref:hypothetical protein n=1 Tax=Rickettsiales endosymbiont of Stachyamoeba lipophora TaxID=2486578 RepID=UPI000F646B96|nr:hypothetical protein [Rickettsiales endosymbiont of Stachyamoeba lipophora]